MVAYNKDKRSKVQKTAKERGRERDGERIERMSDIMKVENVKDHRKMSTKLSFLLFLYFPLTVLNRLIRT